jgi:DNA-binding MarR family transcriptional regulator
MSQLVKLLEQRDYVEQVVDPTDTRAKVIRLTKRGIALRRACEDVRKELGANALKTLGKKDLSKLHQDLNRLIASIRNSDDDR